MACRWCSWLEHHIPGGVLGALVMGGVHLAEIPLDAEQDVPAHDQPVGILHIVGGHRVSQAPGLVQDVVGLDTQVEGADVLGNLRVPLPFGPVVTLRIAPVELVREVAVEFEFVLTIRKTRNMPGPVITI